MNLIVVIVMSSNSICVCSESNALKNANCFQNLNKITVNILGHIPASICKTKTICATKINSAVLDYKTKLKNNS